MKGQGLKSQRAEAGVAEVAVSQDVEARPVEGEVVEVNEANFLKKIKRKKITVASITFFSPRDLSIKPRLGEERLHFLITLETCAR